VVSNNHTTEAVYTFIKQYMEEWGLPPSQREIADGCYIARSAVVRHLDKLEAQGRIALIPGKSRGIRLLKK